MIKLIVRVDKNTSVFALNDEEAYIVGWDDNGIMKEGLYLVVSKFIAVSRILVGSQGDSVHTTIFMPVSEAIDLKGEIIKNAVIGDVMQFSEVQELIEMSEAVLAPYKEFDYHLQVLLSGVFYMDDIDGRGVVLNSKTGHYNIQDATQIELATGW